MTELVFILDRSGSVSGLEADTIGGFNSMIAQQKKEAGKALLDAVGGAIHHIENIRKHARKEDVSEKTLFAIATDRNHAVVQRVKRNSTLTEPTPYALIELVKAVYAEAPDKSSDKRVQHIHIKYNGIGSIPLNELLKEKAA